MALPINNKKKLLNFMNEIVRENMPKQRKKRECVLMGCRNKPVVYKHVFNNKTLPKKWHCKKCSEEV